ncbi:MAG: MMPL family transporter [Bacteroidales bacterium]|nr:MMPL family transporter [Bacteroidales bacterium]
MTKFFLCIYDWLNTRKWFAAIILIFCLTGCALLISQLNYSEDISDFLPHDKKNEKIADAYQHIGGQNKIAIIFTSVKSSQENADHLASVMDAFNENWQKVDSTHIVKNLQVRVNDSAMMNMINFIQQNYPFFLIPADYQRMDSLLAQPNYIMKQLKNDKQMLMLPTGSVFSDNIQSDPLHLFTPVLRRLQSFQISDHYNLYDGCIFTDNWHKSLIFFNSPYGMSESEQNSMLAQMIDHTIKMTQKTYPDVHISAIGAPLIAATNAQQIKHDGILAVSLSIILIFALLICSFRRIGDLLWIIVSIAFGWLFALGGIALYSDHISIIVLGIGSVIIGIAVNYPLHFLDHLKHESDKRQALKEMVPPLLIGNITTVGAFLSLAWMNAAAMRDLGVFGSLVMIGTILFVLVFLPLFAKSRKHMANNKLTFGKLASFSLENTKFLLWPVIILTIILGIFSLQTSFDSNLQHINYMTKQQRQDLNLLSGSLQNSKEECIYAIAEGKNMEEALRNNESLQQKIKAIGKKDVSYVSGIGDFILSTQKQHQAIYRWQKYWDAHRQSVLIELQKASTAQGFSAEAFKPFSKLLSQNYKIQPISFFAPIQQTLGNSYVCKTRQNISIINFVHTPQQNVKKVKKNLNSSTKYFAFNQSDVGSKYVDQLSFDFNYIGYACGFIVFFFLWLSLGRLELSLISFLPLAISWVWILGIMQLLSIQFNIVNIILATFIFGQGDDYTIFITEGLISEYAYHKKMLASYKNSVALSALIMFVGMGTLVFAKHPAMRSLGEVTIIGMFTVVLMAYYFPPLIFKWITMVNGEKRNVPQTLQRIGYSLFSLLFFLFSVYLIWIPYTFIYFHIGKITEKKKRHYHLNLCRISKFIIQHVPGVKFSYENKASETFDKPAVIICNHQSHLDLMCLMMLTPQIIILTNDWVWNNPFYGMIIKYAEFYPVSNGIDTNLPKLKDLTERGYSVVIFPEGTRSEDSSIQRFHRGAFYLAEKLQLDILPIFIHGVGHVLPKKDFMLRKGSIYMEITQRISPTDLSFGIDYRQRTSAFHRYYLNHFELICKRKENTAYYLPYVNYKYMYKGVSVESHCRKMLKKSPIYEKYIDADYSNLHNIWIMNSGQGEFALLFALVNKNIETYAFEATEEEHLLASNCSYLPRNLHFCALPENDLLLYDYPQPDKCLVLLTNERSELNRFEKYHPQYITIK